MPESTARQSRRSTSPSGNRSGGAWASASRNACFAVFYIATAFALGSATTTLGIPRERMLALQLGAIVFMAVGIVAAGYLSDRWSPRRVLTIGCLATVLAGALLPAMVTAGDQPGLFAWLALALTAMGLVYGPLGAWLPSLFAARVRYTGTGIAFNVGGVIGGGLTPLAAQWLASGGVSAAGQGLGPVGLYLASAGVLSLLGLFAVRPRAAA